MMNPIRVNNPHELILSPDSSDYQLKSQEKESSNYESSKLTSWQLERQKFNTQEMGFHRDFSVPCNGAQANFNPSDRKEEALMINSTVAYSSHLKPKVIASPPTRNSPLHQIINSPSPNKIPSYHSSFISFSVFCTTSNS